MSPGGTSLVKVGCKVAEGRRERDAGFGHDEQRSVRAGSTRRRCFFASLKQSRKAGSTGPHRRATWTAGH